MLWKDIKEKYPDKCILIDNVEEQQISETETKILGGTVVKISNDIKEVMKEYHKLKQLGNKVTYSLPSTPKDFIIENVPFIGLLK